MPIWLRLSIAGGATLLVGMGIGRFSYSPMIPALIEADALTAAIERLVRSDDRDTMGRRSRDLVAQRFDMSIVVDAHATIYRQLLAANSPPRARAA